MFRQSVARLLAVICALAACASASGADRKLVEERESPYNRIFVYEDDQFVVLTFGHNRRYYTETVYDKADDLALPVTYTRFMSVALAYAPKVSSILEIGFGGGRTASYLHEQIKGAAITSVELDPVVLELAKKYFGITPEKNLNVSVADGRIYLQRNKGPWDVIMVDAYRGPFVPFHLLTKEFFALAKSRLAPGGVMVQNIEPTTMLFDSAIATIRSVFDNVDAYQANGNIVAVAYDGPPMDQATLKARAQKLDQTYDLRYPITDMLAHRRLILKMPDGKVLTDDFAPVESLLAIERHNRKLEDYTEAPAP